MYKISVYIPVDHAEVVKTAMFNAGAGRYKHYSHCSWETLGTGQFLALEGSNPTIGVQGSIERVEELRVEMICLQEHLESTLLAIKQTHPYEEPAYDVIKIHQCETER